MRKLLLLVAVAGLVVGCLGRETEEVSERTCADVGDEYDDGGQEGEPCPDEIDDYVPEKERNLSDG